MKRPTSHGRMLATGGGVSVLVVTGLAGFAEFTRPGAGIAYQIAGVALLAILLSGAFLLSRFVAKHGDEIGEARFDTSDKGRSDG
jgi:hypothetical protein